MNEIEVAPVKSIFDQPLPLPASVITPDDITMLICLRAHENNPWVIDRLHLIAEHYSPMPRAVVLDFGSEKPFARRVDSACQQHGFKYVHEDDTDTYSAASAHNRGFEACETDLVFFCDADCFGVTTLFADLARIATSLDMKSVVDISLNLPVYHMNEADTDAFVKAGPHRSSYLDAFAFHGASQEFRRDENFFIAPYSNIFLINRRMFDMTGGYDERFRGHGSEDFEYLTRLGIYTKSVPTPRAVAADVYGPLKADFFGAKPFAGFRRFLEAMAYPAEAFGLRAFHLYHPRSRSESWGAQNDWRRDKMRQAFGSYVDRQHNLLGIDFIKRPRKALCICKHLDQWGYFVPLRLAGFKLEPIHDAERLPELTERLLSGEYEALAIFNPHMKSHAEFKPLILLARERGLEVIVIERGALPGTIYYADEVSYTSDQFSEFAFAAAQFTKTDLAKATAYIEELRKGDNTLESMDAYAVTAEKHSALSAIQRRKIFIPLQLEEDMACTLFLIRGDQTYPEFAHSVGSVAEANPDTIFIVKPHPLSNLAQIPNLPNVVIADRTDNIHRIIDIADAVICYNSGVGLLSILHEKPTATVGNAFYNLAGAGYRASSLADAVVAQVAPPSRDLAIRLAAWFVLRKYSTFIATDQIRDFGPRKSHGYRDILVTHFRWGGLDIPLRRQKEFGSFKWRSYASARLAIVNHNPKEEVQIKAGGRRKAVVRPIVRLVGNNSDKRKFERCPAGWFSDLRNPAFRIVGRVVFGRP